MWLCVIISIPVTPLALLCNCGSVESLQPGLQLVLVGRIFLFGGFRCLYICFWSCFDLLVYLCVSNSYLAYSVSVTQFFSQVCLLCGVFPLVLVRGIVRSLLVLSTFVLGGGG